MAFITRFVIIALSLLSCLPALNAQQTRLLTPDKYSDYGMVYALPRTAFEVEIQVRHIVRQAGPFYMYASKYLGTDKVIKADSEQWEVTGVKLRPFGIANDSSIYRMQVKAGQPLTLCVADDGMLLSVNIASESPAGWPQLQNPDPILMPQITEYLQYVDEDFSSAQSDARRAALLAAGLTEIRQARLDLTRGNADNMPTDGRQLELMLNSLANQEEVLLTAFRGREMTEMRSARFSLVPDKEGRYVVARINNATGFVNRNDLSGSPIYIDFKVIDRPQIPQDNAGKELKMPRDGIMYCVPGTVSVTVSWNGNEYVSQPYPMAQFGSTFALDPAIFTSKKAPAYAIFDPATGGIVKIGEVK